MFNIEIEGEYVKIPKSFLIKILQYAFKHCEYVCPAERDPETCIILAYLARLTNLELPCSDEFGNFTEASFRAIIKEIEQRRGKSIEEVLRDIKEQGYKCLQDQIDEMDALFALQVLRAFKKLQKMSKQTTNDSKISS